MVAPRPREPLKMYLAATPQTASAVLVADREEPVLAKQSHASTSPEPHDKEAASTCPQPQENLDKDSSEPKEEPAAATTTTTLVEHPVYFPAPRQLLQ